MKKIIVTKSGAVANNTYDWSIQVVGDQVIGVRGEIKFSVPYTPGKKLRLWLPEQDECYGNRRMSPVARLGLRMVPVSIQYGPSSDELRSAALAVASRVPGFSESGIKVTIWSLRQREVRFHKFFLGGGEFAADSYFEQILEIQDVTDEKVALMVAECTAKECRWNENGGANSPEFQMAYRRHMAMMACH